MKIGFTSVCGDLLHPGHLAMIQEAAGQCDILIVGLICDPTDRQYKNKPVESVFERWYRLICCKGVFNVIPLQGEQDLELALEMLDYDVRFVGEEYRDKFFTGKDICERRGIPIVYNRRQHKLSSTSLRERIAFAEKVKDFPKYKKEDEE